MTGPMTRRAYIDEAIIGVEGQYPGWVRSTEAGDDAAYETRQIVADALDALERAGWLTYESDVVDAEPEHPEHVDCADGCGLAVTHNGPCRTKPGGAVICDESNHVEGE